MHVCKEQPCRTIANPVKTTSQFVPFRLGSKQDRLTDKPIARSFSSKFRNTKFHLGRVFPALYSSTKMKKNAIALVSTTLLITVGLYFFHLVNTKSRRFQNNFIRQFPPHFAEKVASMDLDNSQMLVGVSDTLIYLTDAEFEGRILSIGLSLNPQTIRVHSLPDRSLFTSLKVAGEYLFLTQGNKGKFLFSKLDSIRPYPFPVALPPFASLAGQTPQISIIRIVDFNARTTVFARTADPTQISVPLERQIDGIFCTDGFLEYSNTLKKWIYIYRYRNEFLTIDSLLSIRHCGNTIDTIGRASLKVAERNGVITLSSPPVVVVQNMHVDGNYLFVQSPLVARNESSLFTKHNSSIDVYDLRNGSYLFSFYIPKERGHSIRNFRVVKHKLVALFPGRISVYKLNFSEFKAL